MHIHQIGQVLSYIVKYPVCETYLIEIVVFLLLMLFFINYDHFLMLLDICSQASIWS